MDNTYCALLCSLVIFPIYSVNDDHFSKRQSEAVIAINTHSIDPTPVPYNQKLTLRDSIKIERSQSSNHHHNYNPKEIVYNINKKCDSPSHSINARKCCGKREVCVALCIGIAGASATVIAALVTGAVTLIIHFNT